VPRLENGRECCLIFWGDYFKKRTILVERIDNQAQVRQAVKPMLHTCASVKEREERISTDFYRNEKL
jgi:hypothetical protein